MLKPKKRHLSAKSYIYAHLNFLWKDEFKKALLKDLYQISSDYYEEILFGIQAKNTKFQNQTTTCKIIYEGKIYTASMFLIKRLKALHLHPSLDKEFKEYIIATEEIEEEKKIISRFFTKLLNKINNKEDMMSILGDTFDFCKVIWLSDSDPLSEIQIQEFKQEYATELQIIKERVISNLLMQGVYNQHV